MDRPVQSRGLVNVLVMLAAAFVAFGAGRLTHVLTGQIAAIFLLLGFFNAAVAWFQMRLEERERLEGLEFDEIKKRSGTGLGGSALFNVEAETFPARSSREQFERFFVPGFTLLLMLAQGAAAYFGWRWLQQPIVMPVEQPMVAMGVFGFAALTLFLMGKYSAGLVRMEGQRLLSPSASYLLLGAYLCAITTLVLSVVQAFNLPAVDRGLARALCVLLGLLALESLFALLLEIYRPRVKGKAARLLYESRLVGLLGHPEGLITTAAQALDYQFGFKVSETWFYRFMERALLWLLLAQAAILILSTSFVFIETGEQALLERFGRPVSGREVVGPGFHLKYPWPVDRVHRFRTDEIQTIHIGLEHEEHEASDADDHGPEAILWTVSHAREEFLLLVASREAPVAGGASTNNAAGKKSPPVNLLSASIPVQMRVKSLKQWAYNYSDARQLLEDVATREVVSYLVNADLQEIMSTARAKASADLRTLIQTRADALQLGVSIVSVGLPDIHPPVAVAAAYEAVVGARQKREAAILAAQAHSVRTNGLAITAATQKRNAAQSERHRLEVTAEAEAANFTAQIPAYMASPEVYTQRGYLEVLARGAQNARKVVVVTTNTEDVILLDLEEKIRADMLGLQLSNPPP